MGHDTDVEIRTRNAIEIRALGVLVTTAKILEQDD
jgi:hypothetical protein